jgi:hypothetical protein
MHWAVILTSLAVAVICGGFALQRGYDAYQHFGPAQVGRWMGRWLIGFALAGGAAFVSIRLLRRWRGFELGTYKDGLRFRSQDDATSIRWNEISAVYASAVRYGLASLVWGKRTYLALETYQNTHIDISPSIDGIESLAEVIKKHVYPLLLERYKQQQEEGQSLQFGGILLTPSGITTPKGDLLWGELTEVTLHNGLITLESRQSNGAGRLRLSTRTVPNVELLIQFIRRMGKLA